jgi:hypothetical protein
MVTQEGWLPWLHRRSVITVTQKVGYHGYTGRSVTMVTQKVGYHGYTELSVTLISKEVRLTMREWLNLLHVVPILFV